MKLFHSELNRKIINNQLIFEKKKYGIDQNPSEKAFKISNLHKNAYVKRLSSH